MAAAVMGVLAGGTRFDCASVANLGAPSAPLWRRIRAERNRRARTSTRTDRIPHNRRDSARLGSFPPTDRNKFRHRISAFGPIDYFPPRSLNRQLHWRRRDRLME